MSANGVRLHVAVCGAGPLVVLVHGFPQFWWAWRHQLVGLADAGFQAVAVDVRGCGASDKTPRGYDLWTLAGDVAGLVPALGEERAFVVGHGWGGLVGWTAAALHPRRVRALAVLGAPHPRAARRGALRDGWTRVALALQPPRWPERRLRHDAGVARLLAGWSGADWRGSPEFVAAAARYAAALRIPAAAHCASEPARWAARSQLRAEGRRFAAAVARPTEAPVLALRGTEDPCVTERTLAESAAWTSAGFGVETLAGAGHFPHEETPRAVTARLVAFLGG